MKKFKQYSFYIGIVGAVLAITGVVLSFFGIVNIMPIITEIVAIISAILVSVGLVEKGDSKDKSFSTLKDEIKSDIDKSASEIGKDKIQDAKQDKTIESEDK